MISEAPPFWWSNGGWPGAALSPFGWLYGRVARYKMENAPRVEVGVPVICVGNFTVGGAGKTPTALALGRAAIASGRKVGFLSRGHGGTATGPLIVDPAHHGAAAVGDEPLLLAELAPTAVSRDRIEGARLLTASGVDLIVMDDGFQSARLHFDYGLLAVDAYRGLGNGRLIPAGPVRAPVVDQLRHASAILKIGEGDAAEAVVRLAARAAKPIHRAVLAPRETPDLRGKPVLAFAAIGDPEKFFRTVSATGADLRRSRPFPDHHAFSDEEAEALMAEARREKLTLVTTSKDMVRLRTGHAKAAELASTCRVIAVDLDFFEPSAPEQILDAAQASFVRRKRSGARG